MGFDILISVIVFAIVSTAIMSMQTPKKSNLSLSLSGAGLIILIVVMAIFIINEIFNIG